MRSEAKGPRYILVVLALIASAAALFFGFLAAQYVYLAVMFGRDGPLEPGVTMVFGLLSYVSVVTAAVLFPFIALAAAAIAWLCWKTGTSRLAV
jgi:hypothetical protein